MFDWPIDGHLSASDFVTKRLFGWQYVQRTVNNNVVMSVRWQPVSTNTKNRRALSATSTSLIRLAISRCTRAVKHRMVRLISKIRVSLNFVENRNKRHASQHTIGHVLGIYFVILINRRKNNNIQLGHQPNVPYFLRKVNHLMLDYLFAVYWWRNVIRVVSAWYSRERLTHGQ